MLSSNFRLAEELVDMFGILNKRPNVPARPESVVLPRLRSEIPKEEPAPSLDAPVEVATDALDTPPQTPASDVTEDMQDERSVEEPTIYRKFNCVMVIADTIKYNDVEISSDESEDGFSDSDDEFYRRIGLRRPHYRLQRPWYLFLLLALAGGIYSLYTTAQYEVKTIRNPYYVNPDFSQSLVPRVDWDENTDVIIKKNTGYKFRASQVLIFQTDTKHCFTKTACIKLLNSIKLERGIMNYNFLLGADGYIYEGLGWHEPTPLDPNVDTMAVAFIGNYETVEPTTMQLIQLQRLLDICEEQNYLPKTYAMVGKPQAITPTRLFDYLTVFNQFESEDYDADDEYYDGDCDDELPMYED